MPFIGVQPASALLTSADIQDGQITTGAKIAKMLWTIQNLI